MALRGLVLSLPLFYVSVLLSPLWRLSCGGCLVGLVSLSMRRVYLGGSLTNSSQKPSIDFTTLMNCSKSTGFVM